MKKLKNLFKKDIAIAIGAMILIAVILTWFIPYGQIQGATYYEYGMNRIGLTDLTTLGYYSAYFAIDKVTFLLILGGFYGLLSKTSAYQKITTSIAKKLKGKEIISLVVTSVIIAGLTSISTTSYAVLLFIPFIISVLLKMKLDKMSAFVATFGSMLIGILGATFGTESLIAFNNYFSQSLGVNVLGQTLIIRSVILLVSLVLFNFFTVLHARKVLKDKKVDETKNDRFEVENNTDKKVKTLPLIIVLAIVSVITLLGIINWTGFGIEIFNDFHTWLTSLTIGKDFTIFAYILGNSAMAFGSWDLFTMCTLLFIASIIVAIICKVNFNDYLSNIGNGFIKIGKPVLVLVGVYAVFIAMYMIPIIPTITSKLLPVSEKPSINLDYNGTGVAYFNIDTDDDLKADYNLINQDTDKDKKCDLNCDTDKDGWPDEKLDFDGDGKITKTDKELIDEEATASSVINTDSDGDGIADVNLTTSFSLPKTILASVITNIFHVDLGYTGYAVGPYLVAGFGAIALNIIFLVYVLIFGFIQLFAPTSVILMVGLAYTNIEYKSWFKYAWIFLVSILVLLTILFLILGLV